ADFVIEVGDLVGEGGQLVDHRVDGFLQFGDLAARVVPDLLGEITPGHRGGDLGDRPDLVGQVRRHDVDRLGQVLPGAGDALDVGLTAQPAFGADFAGDAGDLGTERGELVDHGVDGFLQLGDLTARVHGDLLCQVTLGDRGRHFGDRPHLVGEVARHEVHRRGQIPPRTCHSGHLGLAAERAFDTDFAG